MVIYIVWSINSGLMEKVSSRFFFNYNHCNFLTHIFNFSLICFISTFLFSSRYLTSNMLNGTLPNWILSSKQNLYVILAVCFLSCILFAYKLSFSIHKSISIIFQNQNFRDLSYNSFTRPLNVPNCQINSV